jgi:hypothetical protein
MNQVIYAMQFKGAAMPKPGVSGVITASSRASSCTLSSVVGSGGLTGTLLLAQGGDALFESEVTLTGETSFKEAGTIRFADSGHSLRFIQSGRDFLARVRSPRFGTAP